MNARKRCMWRQRGKKGKVNVTKHLNGNVHWNAIVLTRVCSETQLVFASLITNTKEAVLGVS